MPKTLAQKPKSSAKAARSKAKPQKKPGRVPRTQAEAAAKEAAVDGRRRGRSGGETVVVELPLAQVHRNAYNPRQTTHAGSDIVDDELQQLAESIKREGLLQPIEVRADGCQPGHYEVIAGERRWMAHRLNKVKTIRCIVVDVTDEEAKSHCVEENLRRKDLNPIERARSLQLLVDIGLTQSAIAKRVGYANASQVTNELAMLKLPKNWQEAIRKGEIPPTHTRFLAAWRKREPVLQCALNLYRAEREQTGHVSQSRFERIVDSAIEKCSRTLSQSSFPACPFKPTAEQREQLDVVEIPQRRTGGTEPRAFNVTLWKQLAKAANEKAAQKAETQANAGDAAGPKAEKPQPNPWKIDQAVSRWLTKEIAGVVGKLKGETALKAFLLLTMDGDLADSLPRAILPERKGKQKQPGDGVRGLFAAPNGTLLKLLPQVMQDTLQPFAAEGTILEIDLPELLTFAQAVGVDYGEFRPDAAAFEAYPDPLLRDIAVQHGVEPSGKDAPQLCRELAEKWPKGEFPPGFTPKEISA